MSGHRRDIAAHGFLLLAAAALAWPVLVGRTLYYGDITLQFIPWREFARQQLLHGLIPLWLPDTYLGSPFLANDQSAVLYPWHWLTLPLSAARGIALGWLAHLYGSALGGYLFGRSLGHSRGAALLCGLAYGLGGYVVTKQQFPSLAYTIAWLPWLFWATDRLRARPSSTRAATLAVVVGVQWLSGHAQMSVLQLAFLTAWVIASRDGFAAPARRWWVAAMAVGTLAGLAQLLPTYELLRLSPRADFSLADAARFNLPPWQLGGLLLPRLFGCPAGQPPYFGAGPFWETTWYVGLAALPLAAAGARGQRFLPAAAAVGLALALGTYTPVYGWLLRLCPPARMFRDPARFTLYAGFALAVLAARGYDQAPLESRRWSAGLAAAAGFALAAMVVLPTGALERLVGWVLAQSPTKRADPATLTLVWRDTVTWHLLLAPLLLMAVRALLADARRRRALVALLAVELWFHGAALNPTVSAAAFADPRPEPVRQAALIWVDDESDGPDCFDMAQYRGTGCLAETRRSLTPNVNVGTGTRQVGGYDPLRSAAILGWLNEVAALEPAARRVKLAALGVAGEWRDGRWTAWPEAASLVRGEAGPVAHGEPSPQRIWFRGTGLVEWTRAVCPGWIASGAEPVESGSPAVSAWRVTAPAGLGRVRYDPVTYRVGLFCLMLATALAAGWIALRK